MTTAPDIFLSYNREDQARAKLFAEAFEEQEPLTQEGVHRTGCRPGRSLHTLTCPVAQNRRRHSRRHPRSQEDRARVLLKKTPDAIVSTTPIAEVASATPMKNGSQSISGAPKLRTSSKTTLPT